RPGAPAANPKGAVMPYGATVHHHDERVRSFARRLEQQALNLQTIRRLPLHRLDAREHRQRLPGAGIEGLHPLVFAPADDGNLGRTPEALTHERAIAWLAKPRKCRVEAAGRDLLALPDFLELTRLHVVERNDGLEPSVPGEQQVPVGAPLRVGDVDAPRRGLAHLAAARIDQPELACDDPTIAAERFHHGDMAPGR